MKINNNCGSCTYFSDGWCRNKKKDVGYFSLVCDDYLEEDTEPITIDAEPVTKKTCPGCGRELPLENFGKHNRTPDRLQVLCKDCMSERLKQGHRKTKDQKPETPKPETPKPVKPAPAERTTLAAYSDREIYDELLRRGWTGALTRTETLN